MAHGQPGGELWYSVPFQLLCRAVPPALKSSRSRRALPSGPGPSGAPPQGGVPAPQLLRLHRELSASLRPGRSVPASPQASGPRQLGRPGPQVRSPRGGPPPLCPQPRPAHWPGKAARGRASRRPVCRGAALKALPPTPAGLPLPAGPPSPGPRLSCLLRSLQLRPCRPAQGLLLLGLPRPPPQAIPPNSPTSAFSPSPAPSGEPRASSHRDARRHGRASCKDGVSLGKAVQW
ncbi:proline-rich protein HaeIII subfamily 1-like [Monodelphis domestica]|uniref:proline-rich protein HaeIII subfamily 1-like n=1 Tax=Monodelphis domestica TaxID=13616 RepID=UPI0024E1E96A|nr:proline-rich protein HaeIII subfamily 1-like [Monodelphis domestica]